MPSEVAVERDPPGGPTSTAATHSTPSQEGAGGTAPSSLDRKRPAHWSVVEHANRSNIVFVTACSKDRKPIFASTEMQQLIVKAWAFADAWMVGRYVIMPDHVHFFCAPAKYDHPPLKEWVQFWKSLVARAMHGCGPLGSMVAVERDPPTGGTDSTPSSIWQRDFWDTQLRRSDSYSEKWEYVRKNPVRAGLVPSPADWAFQGELNVLRWTE